MSAERAKPAETTPIELAGPADISAWQARLRAVVLDTVGEREVREILEAVMRRAKEGDLQAARMILAYAIGNPPRDDRAEGPTKARPGTARKLDALAYRHVRGVDLHQPGDAGFSDDSE